MNNVNLTDEAFESLLYISRLSADEKEKVQLLEQLSTLIGYLKILDEYVQPNLNSSSLSNNETELRTDKKAECIKTKDLKQMSKEYMDGYFRVPKVLDN